MRVKITLKEDERQAAIRMRRQRDIETPDNFEGPDFHGALDFKVEDGFVVVLLDEALYAYPVESVARYAIYEEKA